MAPHRSTKAHELFIERFVSEYLIDLNGRQAYLRAKDGTVTERTAEVEASKLLRLPKVQALLAKGKQRQLASADLSAQRVLEEMRRLAFFDPGTLLDANGKLLQLHKMSPEARACINSIEVAQANFDKTDGKRSNEWLHKVKWQAKPQVLVALAKHFKLIVDVVEESKPVDWDKRIARMKAARRRVGTRK